MRDSISRAMDGLYMRCKKLEMFDWLQVGGSRSVRRRHFLCSRANFLLLINSLYASILITVLSSSLIRHVYSVAAGMSVMVLWLHHHAMLAAFFGRCSAFAGDEKAFRLVRSLIRDMLNAKMQSRRCCCRSALLPSRTSLLKLLHCHGIIMLRTKLIVFYFLFLNTVLSSLRLQERVGPCV